MPNTELVEKESREVVATAEHRLTKKQRAELQKFKGHIAATFQVAANFQETIQSMLEQEVIGHYSSAYNNPDFLILRKTLGEKQGIKQWLVKWKERAVVDATRVNGEILEPISFPQP